MTRSDESIPDALRFSFEKYGPTPATMHDGNDASQSLRRELGNKSLLLIDFTPVAGVDIAFFDVFFEGVQGVINNKRQSERPLKVIGLGLSEDVEYGVQITLRGTNMPGIAHHKPGIVKLITDNRTLEDTFETAQNLTLDEQGFTSTDLAKTLSLQPANTNQRLMSLLKAGAVARFRDEKADRDKRYIYQAAVAEDLGYQTTLFPGQIVQ